MNLSAGLLASALYLLPAAISQPVTKQILFKVGSRTNRILQDVSLSNILSADDELTSLSAAFDAAGLVDTFDGDGQFTLFAPNDDAFAELDPEVVSLLLTTNYTIHLLDFLAFHVAGEIYRAADLEDGMMIEMFNGETVTVNKNGDAVVSLSSTFTDPPAVVVEADNDASNGILHKVSSALLPSFWGTNLISLIEQSEGFEILLNLIELSGLEEELSTGLYTIFAPTDDAFIALGAEALEQLQDPENAGILRTVLTNHVLDGVYPSILLTDGITVSSVGGLPITVSVDSTGVTVNEAPVRDNDIFAINGIVHVIESILQSATSPPSPSPTPTGTATSISMTIYGTENPTSTTVPTTEPTVESSTMEPSMEPSMAISMDTSMATSMEPSMETTTETTTDTTTETSTETSTDQTTQSSIETTTETTDVTFPPTTLGNDTISLIRTDGNLSNLALAFGLAELMLPAGPLTVFAPEDEAFLALPDGYLDQLLDPAFIMHLRNLLLFHVSDIGGLFAEDLLAEQNITMLNGENVTVNVTVSEDGDLVYIRSPNTVGANVIEFNLEASDGVIHKIDSVLMPAFATIDIDILPSMIDGFDIFFELFNRTSLEALPGTLRLYTLFAPTNEAFESLGQAELDRLRFEASVEEVEAFILNHVANGVYPSTDLEDGDTLATLGLVDITISISENELKLNNADVTETDFLASNGIMHGINQVMKPLVVDTGSISKLILEEMDLTSLASALNDTQLLDVLAEGEYTLFAPVNQAFGEIDAEYFEKLSRQPEWIAHFKNLLLFHVTNTTYLTSDLTDNESLSMMNGEKVSVRMDIATGTVSLNSPNTEGTAITEANLAASNGVYHKLDKLLLPAFFGRSALGSVGLVGTYDIMSDLIERAFPDGLPYSDVTVFAPTDDAFTNIVGYNVLNSWRNPANRNTLVRVLLNHVVSDAFPTALMKDGTSIPTVGGLKVISTLSGEAITLNGANLIAPDILAVDGIIHGLDNVLIPAEDLIILTPSPTPLITTEAPNENGERGSSSGPKLAAMSAFLFTVTACLFLLN